MPAVRVSAIITLGLLVVYYLLRGLATRCVGGPCDVYIPLSLVLPILVVILALVTGVVAFGVVPKGAAVWRWLLGAATVLSVAGPVVSLAIWRDSADTFVAVATVLVLVAPVCALIFSFLVRERAVG